MKNFKNFAIYGLPACSLSNICAMNDMDLNDVFNRFADFVDNNLGDLGDLGKLLGKLTAVLVNNDKEAGLKLLNEHIFNINKDIKDLEKYNNIKYVFSDRKGKKTNNLLILFHGLGQEIKEYLTKNVKTRKSDIDILQENFDADVLLIEYDFNGDNNNTFDGIDKYCEDVANFISTKLKGYDNFTFFGYSLGSFVGNLTRQKFNDIKGENVTSKYIGYKGIKDLDNAGVSFIKTFTKDSGIKITDEAIFNCINGVLNPFGNKDISIENYSDLFKYLLGDDEFNKIKELTNNARILNGTNGFNKENVVFNDGLNKKNGHNISLEDDIESILKVFNDGVNKDKDVFLFQCENGDEVVGKGMADTYYSLIGEKPKHTELKHTDPEPKGGHQGDEDKNKEGNNTPTKPQGGQTQGGQGVQNDEKKDGSCCGIL